jgi:glycosyltransferase involved in cell wall biosynthesis
MLIAHVITRLLRAGSEENTIATCLAQAKAGHEVVLVHGRDSSALQKDRCGAALRLVEVEDLIHPINLRKDVSAVRAMRELFRSIRPTVVHTHQSKAGINGRIAARLAGVPVIVHGVHILPFVNVGPAKKAVYLLAERAVASFTHAFINVSTGTMQSCLDHGVGSREQHFVAHSGFDIERFQRATPPGNWRTFMNLGENEARPPVILMLAALEERKRHVEFLRAFRRVVERIPKVRLLLAGEGPTRLAVEATIDENKLSENVQLLGFHSTPEQLIALADLTVLCSEREGLPRVIVQSLAGARPVVTTDLPGISEIVHNGVNGIVTPNTDLTRTADEIADLLLDEARLARLRSGAAQTDVSSWGLEEMSTIVSRVYEQLVSGCRPDEIVHP